MRTPPASRRRFRSGVGTQGSDRWRPRTGHPSPPDVVDHSDKRLLGWPSPKANLLRRGFGSVDVMTRFVVDCAAVLHLAAEEIEVPEEHELLAPTLLRSQTLSALHEAVHDAAL